MDEQGERYLWLFRSQMSNKSLETIQCLRSQISTAAHKPQGQKFIVVLLGAKLLQSRQPRQ